MGAAAPLFGPPPRTRPASEEGNLATVHTANHNLGPGNMGIDAARVVGGGLEGLGWRRGHGVHCAGRGIWGPSLLQSC